MRDLRSRSKPTDGELGRIMTVARGAALRMGANDTEADEVAQSTVVRFWIRWNTRPIAEARERSDARWDGYVWRSAVNIFRDRVREHQRRLLRQYVACTLEATVPDRPGTTWPTTPCPCPIEELMIRTAIAEEIETLPTAGQRQVARAIFLEGKTTAEVADELGIQPQAVRKHLRPARERLTARLMD